MELVRCCCACAGGGVVGDGAWCGEMMAMLVMKPAGDPAPPATPRWTSMVVLLVDVVLVGLVPPRRREGGDVVAMVGR